MPSAQGFVFNRAPTAADVPQANFDWLGNLPAAYQVSRAQALENQMRNLQLAGAQRGFQEAFGVPAPGQQAMQGAPQQGQAPSPGGLYGAIWGTESGNRSNVSDSNRGAMGPGQIIQGTWDAYAQPGENIRNPDDNRRVSARIIDDLSKKFNGDPARVAVGYFSGEGNVAPPGSPTPWKFNKSDGSIPTSEYVRRVMARLRTGGETTDREARADQAERDVQAELGGNRTVQGASPAPVEQPPGAVGTAPFMASSSQYGAGPANLGGETPTRASERTAQGPSPTGPENRGGVPQGPSQTVGGPTGGAENEPYVRAIQTRMDAINQQLRGVGFVGPMGAGVKDSLEKQLADLTAT
jgi:hypothetical protein